MKIEQINEELNQCQETIFDTFDLSLDLKITGGALRDRLSELTNLCSRINHLASNALMMYEKAKTQKDKIESLVWKALEDRKLSDTKKKIFAKTFKILIDEEGTTINEQEERVALYHYMSQRGKDKMKEAFSALEVGRSLLSWDKAENTRSQY